MLNNNYQNILIKFGLWFATGFLIMLVGITGVFADTYPTNYDTDLYYYDNRGSSISSISTTWNESLQTYVSGNITTAAGSYGGAVGFSSPVNILKDHTYTFSIYFLERNNIALSSKNKIGLGNGPYNSCNNYATNNFKAETLMSTVTKNTVLTYSFKATENASYICMPWTTTSTTTQSYAFTEIIIDDLGSSGVSQQDINNSLNNQTTILNNTINNMQQSIINNQNDNTQAQIESQKVCDTKKFDNDSIIHVNKALNGSGNLYDANNFGVSDFISIDNYVSLKVLDNLAVYTCFYDSSKISKGCITTDTITTLNIPDNSKYMRITFSSTSNKPILELYTCKNGNQALNDSINDLNSSLTDSSLVNMDSLGNTAGWLPPGPIDSIINLPLNLFNNLLTALNGTCQPINIPLPYVDKNLPIPCISTIFNQIDGLPGFWNWVGAITSVVILYRYLLALYKYYDDLTTLKANFISDFGGEP